MKIDNIERDFDEYNNQHVIVFTFANTYDAQTANINLLPRIRMISHTIDVVSIENKVKIKFWDATMEQKLLAFCEKIIASLNDAI